MTHHVCWKIMPASPLNGILEPHHLCRYGTAPVVALRWDKVEDCWVASLMNTDKMSAGWAKFPGPRTDNRLEAVKLECLGKLQQIGWSITVYDPKKTALENMEKLWRSVAQLHLENMELDMTDLAGAVAMSVTAYKQRLEAKSEGSSK